MRARRNDRELPAMASGSIAENARVERMELFLLPR